MTIKSKENSLGAWAFLIGVILALLIGLSTTIIPIPALTAYSAQIYAILSILGLIVGFVNVTGKESQTFLLAGAVLVIVSRFGMDSVTGSLIGIGVGDTVSSIFKLDKSFLNSGSSTSFMVLLVKSLLVIKLSSTLQITSTIAFPIPKIFI